MHVRCKLTGGERIAAVAKLAADIAGLLCPVGFVVEGGEDFAFERLPAFGVDRMGDVAVHFHAFSGGNHAWELHAALVAEAGVEVILGAAAGATGHDFPRRHRDEKS